MSAEQFLDRLDDRDALMLRSIKLVPNGESSLTTTIPQEFWMNAGIDRASPGYANAYYFPEDKKLVIDLNKPPHDEF